MKIIIDIEDSCIKYHLELDRRINFIVGNSGTGKTTIVDLVNSSLNDSSISINTNIELYPVTLLSWRNDIKSLTNKLIIMDDLEVVSTMEFASLVKNYCIKNNLYFLIMCRDDSDTIMSGCSFLSYSMNSIYKLVMQNGIHILVPYYKYSADTSNDYDICIVEDSKAGLEFFKNLFKGRFEVVSSNGKSGIVDKVEEKIRMGYSNIFVIFDTASFGCHFEEFHRKLNRYDINVCFMSTYECFEELLIQSNIVNHLDKVKYVLNDLPNFDNTHVSWETYFEEWLYTLTKDKQYVQRHGSHHSKLNDCYLIDCGSKGRNKDGYICKNLCDVFLKGNKFEEMLRETKYKILLN